MTRQRTITALLAAIVVLLGLNLMGAQPKPNTRRVTGIQAEQAKAGHTWRIFRLYSDGSVDVKSVEFHGPQCKVLTEYGPAFVVGSAP